MHCKPTYKGKSGTVSPLPSKLLTESQRAATRVQLAQRAIVFHQRVSAKQRVGSAEQRVSRKSDREPSANTTIDPRTLLVAVVGKQQKTIAHSRHYRICIIVLLYGSIHQIQLTGFILLRTSDTLGIISVHCFWYGFRVTLLSHVSAHIGFPSKNGAAVHAFHLNCINRVVHAVGSSNDRFDELISVGKGQMK